MKVKILQWHAVASWTWDAQDETCGICRMAFDGCCPDCKLPGDDCPLIWGACNHAFHLHCILKWVNSQTSQAHCPMCRREWQFKGWENMGNVFFFLAKYGIFARKCWNVIWSFVLDALLLYQLIYYNILFGSNQLCMVQFRMFLDVRNCL